MKLLKKIIREIIKGFAMNGQALNRTEDLTWLDIIE